MERRRSSVMDSGSVVCLNVGGTLFTTYKATLLQHPDSMLAALISGTHSNAVYNGATFIDRDAQLFEYILDFLRSGPDFELPSDQRTRRRLLREFRYFQLPTAAVFADQPLSLARVYAVGGSTDIHMHRPVGTVMCYDTNFDGWCDVAELPVARACVAATTLGSCLYVLGGKDTWGKEMTGVTTCDLTTHATSTDCVRSMATPRHTFGAATAASKVYAVGHGRLGDEADTVEFFDPGSGAWWSTSALPFSPKHHAVCAWPGPCGEPGGGSTGGPSVHSDHSTSIFSCGGHVGLPGVGLACSRDLLQFDVRAKAWRALMPMPGPRAKHGLAACGGRLYVVGGSSAAAGAGAGAAGERPTAACHCYDVRAGRWAEVDPAPLPCALESLAAVAVSGQVHVMGGLSGTAGASVGSGNNSPRVTAAERARPRSLNSPGIGGGGGGGGPLLSPLAADEVGVGLLPEEARQAQDGVLRYDPTCGGAWLQARAMRAPMHSMAAVAYQS